MSWTTTSTKTAKHTCGGPVFGRKTPGCPRCDEMLAGAPAVKWAQTRAQEDAQLARSIRQHSCNASGCGRVCTFGQW